MRKSIRFILFLTPAAAFPVEAFAYLDPGTGSMLLSVIVGLISSLYFLLHKLPSFFRALYFRITGKADALQSNSIVFYSESASYWSTFEPVLRALAKKDIRVTYLTSDPNDPVFSSGLERHVQAKYIGKGNTAYTALGFLQARCFVLTTPGIDVLQIRRSSGVTHYVHIVHAACDIHTYKFYSFDYYDAVFCSGPGQVRSLRELEKKRGTREKHLPVLGCPYYDGLLGRHKRTKTRCEENTVLVAPTWGKNSLLSRTGSLIPKLLAQAGFTVIVRPHPQSYISDKAMMEKITRELAPYPNVVFDRERDGFVSLSRAAVMVSDISGIILDYAFTFLRPVIAVGDGPLREGFEAWELDHPAWDQAVLPRFGQRIDSGRENTIVEVVRRVLAKKEDFRSDIEAIRKDNVVNFGCATEAIAEELVKLSETEATLARERQGERA